MVEWRQEENGSDKYNSSILVLISLLLLYRFTHRDQEWPV